MDNKKQTLKTLRYFNHWVSIIFTAFPSPQALSTLKGNTTIPFKKLPENKS